MNIVTIFVILIAGSFVAGYNVAMILTKHQGNAEPIEQEAHGLAATSTIVDPGEFDNISYDFPNIHWLSTRTRFNNNGMVIVGYDMLLSSVQEIDRVLGVARAQCPDAISEIAAKPHTFTLDSSLTEH